MKRILNKEKVINILTNKEFKHSNVFNIIPNLSDKVVDYIEDNYDYVELIEENFKDKRKYESTLSVPLFIMSGIQSRMKQQFSINELSLAITSKSVINSLKSNIEYNPKESLIKESNVRAFIDRYETKNDKEELIFNNDFIEYCNILNEKFLTKANIEPNIHILDCSILDVNLDNKNYEGSSITYKGGEKLKGYKIGALRGVTPNGGVIEEICMSSAKVNDLEMSKEMIIKSKHLKENDYFLYDRGFLDIEFFRELVNKKINNITPVRKNMDIYIAAVNEAISNNNWLEHPNKNRKGQNITLIENLEMFWLNEKEKKKKPDKIKLDYKINGVVIRFDREKNKKILSDDEMYQNEGKYAYAVIVTNDISLSAEEIIRLYEMRPEIEEDFRQLKDFWGLNTYKSTKYKVISFIIILSILSYNLYQVFKESEEGKNYIGKSFIVEERHGLYIVKNVRTAIIVDDYFAIFEMDELLDLYADLSKERRTLLKGLLVL